MWLRLYTSILDDPKVQSLEPAHFKGWINLLCVARDYDGMLPDMQEIAWYLRLSQDEAATLVAALTEYGLLDATPFTPRVHNWDKWQRKSEIFADRLLQGDWPTIRLQVLDRDNWQCQYCGD